MELTDKEKAIMKEFHKLLANFENIEQRKATSAERGYLLTQVINPDTDKE